MIVHALQELGGDGVPRSRTNDRIHRAFRTDGSLIFIDPCNDLARRVSRETVEAAAKLTLSKLLPIIAAMAMCTQVILIWAGNGQAKFDHATQFTRICSTCAVAPLSPSILPQPRFWRYGRVGDDTGGALPVRVARL